MSGIDRLRAIAGAWDEWGLGGTLAEMADQIESELREERDRWDDDLSEAQVAWNRVAAVMLDMERHCLGHEGMEDSPVARWARELRKATGTTVSRRESDAVAVSRDALTDEDREAAEWVRKRGGLDHVRVEWNERVPRDRYKARRQSLLGHIAECETALGRRREIISKLTHHVKALANENVELRRRAMPEGMEWMLWDDGKPVTYDDAPDDVIGVYLALDGSGYVLMTDLPDQLMSEPSERVRRPAVPAADGEPLEVGQTVYDIANGKTHHVTEVDAVSKRFRSMEQVDGSHWLDPMCFTHQRPVLSADGRPLRKGDKPYRVDNSKQVEVRRVDPNYGEECVFVGIDGTAFGYWLRPDQLTRTKPEIDTWQRIEDDARGLDGGVDRELFTHTHEDIVRRCRALSERERGE